MISWRNKPRSFGDGYYNIQARQSQNGRMDGLEGLRHDSRSRNMLPIEKEALQLLRTLMLLSKWKTFKAFALNTNPMMFLIWTKPDFSGRYLRIERLLHIHVQVERKPKTELHLLWRVTQMVQRSIRYGWLASRRIYVALRTWIAINYAFSTDTTNQSGWQGWTIRWRYKEGRFCYC